MKNTQVFKTLVTVICIFLCKQLVGQTNDSRVIQTAVPFLFISPDARSSAMGETGTAISQDANAMYWNCATMPLLQQKHSMSISYIPWLKDFASDVHLFYGSYVLKIDSQKSIGASVRIFSLGEQSYTDENNSLMSKYTPTEMAADIGYSKKLGDHFSIGTALRFIYSGLYDNAGENQSNNSGTALAADVSVIYSQQKQNGNNIRSGLAISNIGQRISYFKNGQAAFLPTNLRLSVANSYNVNEKIQLTIALDFKKLLVPTPPILNTDGTILSGKAYNQSVISSIFSSFSDAPGGFKEELREIDKGIGTELNLANKISIRTGYCFQHPSKGDHQYLTTGLGITLGKGNIDMSYLISNRPTNNINTFRVSLRLSLFR
jgi:hypothetical protein